METVIARGRRCVPGEAGSNTANDLVSVTDPVNLPTAYGQFATRAWVFRDGTEHLSVTALGVDPENEESPYIRMHSECLTGDVFGSRRCDCGQQLDAALEFLAVHGGTLLYLRGHEGRGIGLANKLRAYALQEQGLDTVDANLHLGLPADARDYTQAAVILWEMGIHRLKLVTNNPGKAEALTLLGLEVVEMQPDEIEPVAENAVYLATKRDRMNHLLRAVYSGPEPRPARPHDNHI